MAFVMAVEPAFISLSRIIFGIQEPLCGSQFYVLSYYSVSTLGPTDVGTGSGRRHENCALWFLQGAMDNHAAAVMGPAERVIPSSDT